MLQWLPPGGDEETPFLQYAVEGELAEFIAWLDPVIEQWQAQEAQATAERGIKNTSPHQGRRSS